MTPQPPQCGSCSCGSKTASEPVDVEDCYRRLAEAQTLICELQAKQTEASAAPEREQAHTNNKASLRSKNWFTNAEHPDMMAIYLERYLNYGLTASELTTGKPIIGIAQTGSDLAPCNRHHLELSKRVREGIRQAGGIAFEFPMHPIQETGRRPTANLDRNLAYLGLVEVLHGYPLDGVVLLTGCDKTTPACLMAAATVDIPAICLNVGPMLSGRNEKGLVGAGPVVWRARELYATGEIDLDGLIDLVSSGTPSVGHCNSMGTASTMNALAEALGMALPGSAAIPAPYRQRAQCAYETGLQIVEMVREDRKPSDILTREAFENAIVVNSAIGGSTNAPIHTIAIAKHVGIDITVKDWDEIGFEIPLLLNMQPAGEYLGEDYFYAGGLPAIMAELLDAGKLHPNAITCNGQSVKDNVINKHSWDRRVIKPFAEPIIKSAGFIHMSGNLFDSAIMKASVISPEFRANFLQNPDDPNAFEGSIIVFDGPEDYHRRIEDPSLDISPTTILVMRGAGPIGYPGAAEVVNMQPPARLIAAGIHSLPCLGDGRQSGTSASPSILNACPEAAAGGNMALLKDGDRVRVDLNLHRVDLLLPHVDQQERRAVLENKGGFSIPPNQTPWQEIFRQETTQLNEGMVLRKAVKYQKVGQSIPRDNH